jgi:orotate phosphoribosyltransferase-like protein
MSAVKDLFYDIETMFIEGKTAREISKELNVPLDAVEDVLDSFGVSSDDIELDVDAADWDEVDADDYYGA